MMVGNSLKSDVIPAIEAGGWGVHVPHAFTWAMERAPPPLAAPRYRRLAHLGELVGLVRELPAGQDR
jgi:putative hydrolase of the HAD superfamily